MKPAMLADRSNCTPLVNVPKAKRPKKRVRPVSKRRALETPVYLAKRKAFLEEHPWCAVWWAIRAGGTDLKGTGRATEVHHKLSGSRRRKSFLDESTWLAVSIEGHRWIHAHPAKARARGWLL